MASESAQNKVCSNCGVENGQDAAMCKACDKERFEPLWVMAHRPINRQLSVQITSSNPDFGEVEKRITLNKWWPGGRSTFHLRTIDQWEKIQDIINDDLAPKLGWTTAAKLAESASKKAKDSKLRKDDFKKLANDYPEFLKELVASIDPSKFSQEDFGDLLDSFGNISDVLTNANAGFRTAFLKIVKKLPKQKQRALEDLSLLLEGWSLNVVTNVANQVRSRLETIELFEEQIQDPRTFEIIGDNSIHRILERAMWLVNEEYWLLHSNKSLRTQIADQLSKEDKKRYGSKRPDFSCGTIGQRLIILELKRPGHELTIDDLNQLETYLAVSKRYFTAGSVRGFLVGSSIGDELQPRLEFRKGSEILLYSNIIDRTKKRYHAFLDSLDRDE